MTHELTIEYSYRLSASLLDEEMQTALGAIYAGLSTYPGGVRVFLTEQPTAQTEADVRAVLDAHDPRGTSTADQEAATARARIEALIATDTTLTTADFDAEPALIRQLARKVLLLEALLRR